MSRFIFDDNEKSNWSVVSPISDFTEETPTGYMDDEANYYKITLKTSAIATNTVKYVEFAFRRHLADTWKSIKTTDFTLATGYVTYSFNGFEQFSEIAASESSQLFENVPIQSGTLELLPSSHLVFIITPILRFVRISGSHAVGPSG